MRLTSTGGGGFNVVKDGQDIVSSLKAPTLILESRTVNDIPNATIGGVYTRTWRFRNTGTSSTVDTVWFRVIYQPGTFYTDLEVNGVFVAPTRISGDTIWYRQIQTLRNQSVFPADTVLVRESFRVNGCTDPSGNSNVSVYWGCLGSPVCNSSALFPSVQIPNTVPDLRCQLVSINNGCYGDYDTVTVRFINRGNGPAANVIMRVDQSSPNESYTFPNGSSMSFIDTASISVRLNSSGVYTKAIPDSTVQYGFSRSFWPVSNPTATFYIERNLLGAGDTFFIRFRRFRGLYDNSMCTVTENYVNYMSWYTNRCGTAMYFLPKTNLAGEAHHYYGKTGYAGPAYLLDGDTGNFTFTTQRGSGFNHFRTANDFFMMRIEVPAGLVWDNDTSKLRFTNLSNTFTKAVDSWSWNPTTRVLEAYYRNYTFYNGQTCKPGFVLDCGLGAVSGVSSIFVQYFNVRPVSRCGFQVLPFSCRDGNPVTLICPGVCPRGGVVPYFARARRLNFGLPDNNNDGIPDGTGSIDMNRVEWDKMAPRDTFELVYRARIIRGSQSPDTFRYGYARIWIPSYGIRVTPINSEVIVKDQSAGSSFTVSNLPFTIFDTSSRRTVMFDFSRTVSGFPGGYFFDNGDSIELKLRFVFNSAAQESANPDDLVTTTNTVFVSHLINPTDDTARYRCLDLPSNYRVVNVYKGYNGGFVSRPTGCNQTTVYSDYYQSVGDCCDNYAGSLHFPYEYRLFTTLDTVRIRIPSGYILDSSRIAYVFTAGAGKAGSRWFSLTPFSINGEWYTFLLTPFYTFAGGSQVPSTTGSYWQMYNYIRASCSVPVNSITTQFTADRWIGRASWTGISTRGVANNHTRGTYVFQGAAQLDLSNVGATVVQGINRTVSWDFQVQNNAVSATANNVWIGSRTLSGRVIVDSIRNLTTNMLLPQTNGIFRAGDIAGAGATRGFRLYASYTACDFDSLNIYTGWNCAGYPANLTAAIGSCRADSIRTYVIPLDALVQTDLISAPADPSPLCDTLNWTVSVSSRQVAAAYDVFLDFVVPNGGAGAYIVAPYQYKYPANASSWKTITPVQVIPGTYRFYFSDSVAAIKTDGLRPIGEAPMNEILLKVRMVTNCNYTSGSSVRFVANARKACGAALPRDAEFNPVNITGAPGPKLLVLGSITPGVTTCDSQFLMEIKLYNYEAGASSANDQLWALLPAGTFMVPGTLSFIKNPFVITTPTIDTVGGRQRLRWVAQGLPAFDSTVIQLKYISPSDISCGGNSNLTLLAVSSYIATCATISGGICNSFIENNRLEQDRPVLKPELMYNTGSGFMRMSIDTTAGNVFQPDTLILSGLNYRNIGTDTADLPVLKAFNDANNNSRLDVGETIFFADTLPPVNPGDNTTYSRTATWGHGFLSTSTILKIEMFQKCNCNQSRFTISPAFTLVPLDVSWLYFDVRKNSGDALITWATTSENGSDYFIIEQLMPEGTFKGIARIQAAGNSHQTTYYKYLHKRPDFFNGSAIFRIKLVSLNGEVQFTELRGISESQMATENIQLVPNPAGQFVMVLLPDELDYTVTFYSMDGRKMLTKSVSTQFNRIEIDKLTPGIYTVNITGDGISEVQRLIVK